ncbi:BRCT domain-containing protein [Pseudomonas viridiflava]|uniref:BRCT domain-containing protein n=1 Tax=Pseudomonas viridiflava TaxID=33069 RepID=UPI000F03346F|nr:BRCT domain-containing protein [Pseudomonas viridiflava]MBI6702145.1 BRCT domain-containing protein [Pseudomonas viridiflava]MBI6724415.1 BRCT domain-containing protein [Pseudomonas viridiflava]
MTDIHQEFQKSRFFHQERIDRKSVDALIGISVGLIADGQINQLEAQFLQKWIETNLTHLDDPVVNILFRRLNDMLSDGILSAEEAEDLMLLLKQFTGIAPASNAPALRVSSLPLNDPLPIIDWSDRTFMLTGTMAYGPRKSCESLIVERGGLIGAGVSKKVHYLIVGSVGNEQWLHSSYGTKIKRAVELRESGVPIAIVSEEHWQKALFG